MNKVTRYKDLVERVERLEGLPPAASAGRLHKLDQDTYKRFGRAARFTVTARLPAITSKTAAPTLYVHSWSSSYPANGEAISVLESLVPGFVAAIPSPGAGYTFTWNHATGKLLAYTTAGTEVVATTNLSTAVGTTPILVYGVQPSIMEVYQARGDETIQSVVAAFEEDVAIDGTNFWSIEARIRDPGDSYGRALVSAGLDAAPALSNAKRSFVAGQSETLYEAVTGPGTRLSSDARVVLYAAPATQSCKPLGDVTVTIEMQRKVT